MYYYTSATSADNFLQPREALCHTQQLPPTPHHLMHDTNTSTHGTAHISAYAWHWSVAQNCRRLLVVTGRGERRQVEQHTQPEQGTRRMQTAAMQQAETTSIYMHSLTAVCLVSTRPNLAKADNTTSHLGTETHLQAI